MPPITRGSPSSAFVDSSLRAPDSSKLKHTAGFVGEAAALGEAEAAQAMGDHDDAVDIYEDLLENDAIDTPAIWLSLANAALADGDRKRAGERVSSSLL